MDSSLKNEIDTENGSYSQNHHQDFVNHEIHQNNLTTITKNAEEELKLNNDKNLIIRDNKNEFNIKYKEYMNNSYEAPERNNLSDGNIHHEDKMRIDWNHLLKHIMERIFFHLSKTDDFIYSISALRLTSKSCYYASSAIFHSLEVTDFPVSAMVRSFTSSFVNVTQLKILNPSNSITSHFVECCHLKSLTIYFPNDIKGLTAQLIYLGKLNNLEHLNLKSIMGINSAGIHAISGLKKLKTLSIGYRLEMSYKSFVFLMNFKELEHLELHGTDAICDEGLIILKNLKNLKTIFLNPIHQSKNFFSKLGMMNLREMRHLSSLTLYGCDKMNMESLKPLSNLKNLTYLKLKQCLQLHIESFSIFKNMEQLQTLKLINCPKITPTSLLDIQSIPNLQNLHLGNCNDLSDTSLIHFQSCKKLRYLKLIKCQLLSEIGLEILKECPEMERIKLIGAWSISIYDICNLILNNRLEVDWEVWQHGTVSLRYLDHNNSIVD